MAASVSAPTSAANRMTRTTSVHGKAAACNQVTKMRRLEAGGAAMLCRSCGPPPAAFCCQNCTFGASRAGVAASKYAVLGLNPITPATQLDGNCRTAVL